MGILDVFEVLAAQGYVLWRLGGVASAAGALDLCSFVTLQFRVREKLLIKLQKLLQDRP